MPFRDIEPLKKYVAAVTVAGLIAGICIVATYAGAEVRATTPAVVVLMILVIAGELYPIFAFPCAMTPKR